ncbi:MAG TPA: HAD family hydrolase [Ktedonobacteraceae bacterium]|jgi:HAD superfamily hydrolase (TIGR01549 family)
MKQRWAVLIDLDQTLVETSALAELRRQRKWQQVYQSFHLTTLFSGTQLFLQDVQKLPSLSLGVVTTSPRPYAEQLVAYHHCQVPVVVAYHDSPRHKPFPDPIVKAAERLRIPPANCFHIGDAPNDIIAAIRASAIPIGLCWDSSLRNQLASLPAFPLCANWSEVLQVIMNTIEAKEN